MKDIRKRAFITGLAAAATARALAPTIGLARAEAPVPSFWQPCPRRNRLTKTMGSGIRLRTGIDKISGGGLPLTHMYVVPIEAPCYAVRLGFGNCFNAPMVIQSASVWPSDSYSQCLAMQAANGASNTTELGPTGGAPGSKIYFDNAGADNSTIAVSGSERSLTLPGVASNAKNASQSFTIQWSDFVPCTSIQRADGGMQHLLFTYVTVSSPSISSDISNFRAANLDPIALRGRYVFRGFPWAGGKDWSDMPTGTGWKEAGRGFGPLFCIQYLTANPGLQVVLSGDSLSESPTNDQYSTPLHRAAWDLSTPDLPIEVASTAWGAANWNTYGNLLRSNMAALHPSVIAYQPLSRNDGAGAATLQLLLARVLSVAEEARASFGTGLIFNSAGCEPSWSGNPQAIAGFVDLRARLQAITKSSGIPLIDGPSVLGQPNEPWNYLPGVSDDNTHANFAGAELVVPLARKALSQILART